MKLSIRKFLLINLLLAITITTTLTAIGNYYLDQKDIQEHLDSLMATSALSYQALLGEDIHYHSLQKIQNNLSHIPKKIENYYHLKGEDDPIRFLNKFSFQVLDANNKLILYSKDAPATSLASQDEGFSDRIINKQKWRVFTAINKQSGVKTVLAESYNTRNELGQRIAQDDLYIMLLTFPLSGLLIWIIIGRGLETLDRIAHEVADRAPTHLEPVNIKEIPDEIKPVIDALNELFHRLKEAFEREKRFAADAAHELRTPLAALKAQAQVAININGLEEKNQALEKLISSVNRSTHVVQQLLTMSKLVPESPEINDLVEVNLIKIAREILAMLAPSAVEKHVDLEFEAENDVPSFKGNTTALGILIRNIVDNAIRYANEQGKVLVRAYKDKQEVILEVSDNGPGIPADLHHRVFERFFRVLGNKSTGSGLGLAIVQQICSLHGGHITLDAPKEGTGLIVRVHFPIPPSREF